MPRNAHGKSCKQDWCTPWWFVQAIEKHFDIQITLDVCAANRETSVCRNFITPNQDGLQPEWRTVGTAWCNPPWSQCEQWIDRAIVQVHRRGPAGVCVLTPASIETKWFQKYHMYADIYLITPRLNYWDPVNKCLCNGISRPSALWRIPPNTVDWPRSSETLVLNYLHLPRPPDAQR